MGKTKELIIAIGSNTSQQTNMKLARQMLIRQFGEVVFTRDLETTPIGLDSDSFLNCLACTQTTLMYRQVKTVLKQLEQEMGASEEEKAAGRVIIDLDILRFNGRRYHVKDWDRPYVKQLISELNKIKTK
ncbi:MAG: 2-amino-4-hydroxy-6-hydroxymethyldihydropteridine diphosphokinase [Prevotella sp.]|nr:2-amino-4-hydroxy-6-hydroxymethyldihydropteridine diphosphokinase [Prevotella sp.]